MSAVVKKGGPEVKKFEQVSSDGHQVSLAGGPLPGGPKIPCPGGACEWGLRLRGTLYSEVQYIMGNGHMGLPMDIQTRMKTLPSRNFVGGR